MQISKKIRDWAQAKETQRGCAFEKALAPVPEHRDIMVVMTVCC